MSIQTPQAPGWGPPIETPTPQVQRNRRWGRNLGIGILAAIVGFVMLAVGISILAGGQTPTDQPVATALPASAFPGTASTYVPPDTRIADTLTWWSNAAPLLATMADNFAAVSQAANDGDLGTVGSASTEALATVHQLKDLGPLPLPSANKHWQKALDAYDKGLATAIVAANDNDVLGLLDAIDNINTGNNEMNLATAEVSSDTG